MDSFLFRYGCSICRQASQQRHLPLSNEYIPLIITLCVKKVNKNAKNNFHILCNLPLYKCMKVWYNISC
jgi:hypothetical protein